MFHFRAIFVISPLSVRFKPACENQESPLHLRSDGGKPPGHCPHGSILTNNIMAIIKGTFGTSLQKRIGQVVYRNRGGVNIASARPASVKNPRTSAQMKQRMIFTTVQSAYKKMREIVDHSQEGVTYGAKTMASFMKMNLIELSKNYSNEDVAAFNLKGNTNVVAPYPFKIATGNLIFDAKVEEISDNAIRCAWNSGQTTLATMTYSQLLSMLGVKKGDQLTFVMCAGNWNKVIDDNGYKQFSENYFRPIRVVFSRTAVDTALAFSAEGKLNNEICDQTNSDFLYHDLVFKCNADKDWTISDSAFGPFEAGKGWELYAGAIILSRLTNSVWQRSDTNLTVAPPRNQTWGPAESVLESYNPASNYYLNNATV